MPDSQSPQPVRRGALAFIFVTVLVDVLALGIVIPVLPKLVENFLGGNTAGAARIFGAFGTVWALMQFIFAPILGMVSDRFGRRSVILISCLGLGLDYAFMACAPTLGWLFVGRIISGITAASFATAGAYIADVTPSERRAASYGFLGAAWGFGFAFGPALGGLLGGINPRLPFWVAAVLALANAAYGWFVLPESLPPEKRSPRFVWARANPVGSLRLLRSHHELFGLAAIYFIVFVAHQVLTSVFVLYSMFRYRWTESQVGLCLAIVGICSIVVQGILVKPIVPRLGERRALLLGLVFGVAGFAIFGWAPSGAAFCCGIPVFALIGFFGPSAQSLMSKRVSPSEQGQLQGANSSLMGIAGMIGPGLFTLIFAHYIAPTRTVQIPGAAFYLASVLMGGAFVAAWMATRSMPMRPPGPGRAEETPPLTEEFELGESGEPGATQVTYPAS